jgi:hypothetical protein
MNGGDDSFILVHQENRQAIRRLNDQENAGEGGNGGVTLKAYLRDLLDDPDDIGMHLPERYERHLFPLRFVSQVFSPPSGVAEPVIEKGNPVEPGNGDQPGLHS